MKSLLNGALVVAMAVRRFLGIVSQKLFCPFRMGPGQTDVPALLEALLPIVQLGSWRCPRFSLAVPPFQSGGLEVVSLLQMLCSNEVDVPVGHIVQTGMQNDRGGYENDCILVRMDANRWVLGAGGATLPRCSTLLPRTVPIFWWSKERSDKSFWWGRSAARHSQNFRT